MTLQNEALQVRLDSGEPVERDGCDPEAPWTDRYRCARVTNGEISRITKLQGKFWVLDTLSNVGPTRISEKNAAITEGWRVR